MKKTLAIILSITFVLLIFSSCKAKPTAELNEENIIITVDTAFNALKNVDTKKLNQYVSSTTLSLLTSYIEDYNQFEKLGKSMFSNLSYEIKKVDVINKTVTISVLNKDLSEISTSFAKELASKYSPFVLLMKLSDEKWLDENLSKLTKQIKDAKMQTKPTQIVVNIFEGDENLVLGFDEQGENAISGGVISAITNAISNNFE